MRELIRSEARRRDREASWAAGLAAHTFEHTSMEIYAAKKIYTRNLLKETVVALSRGKEWQGDTTEELALLQVSKDLQLPGIRLVGADEE